jgi:hypothetical protein
MRVLLRSLYRDFLYQPKLQQIREANELTRDWAVINPHYTKALESWRFLGLGNPSESGTHLLYYFRQENQLPTRLFISQHELFRGSPDKPASPRGVERLIFIDDFCGSGTQARKASKTSLKLLRAIAPNIRFDYLCVFATARGLDRVRKETVFDEVHSLFLLDDSFKTFGESSRYFARNPSYERKYAESCIRTIGAELWPAHPLGYKDGQLLVGFAHNVPNNTLPIFWSDGSTETGSEWKPIFSRYAKA